METVDPKTFCPVTSIADIAENWTVTKDIPYYAEDESDPVRREACLLDIHYPRNRDNVPVLLFLHGGGLVGGDKSGLIEETRLLNCIIVSANYRLGPQAKCPAYLEDAAMAAAWTLKHIGQWHGDPKNVFVFGSSAGAYLTAMLAAKRDLLAAYGAAPEDFRGFIPLSGEMMTHFQVRAEQGIPDTVPVIDDYAPLHYVRPDFPPLLMITGETGIEMDCRPAENKFMRDMLTFCGCTTASYYEMRSLTHGTIWTCVNPYMRDFIQKYRSY